MLAKSKRESDIGFGVDSTVLHKQHAQLEKAMKRSARHGLSKGLSLRPLNAANPPSIRCEGCDAESGVELAYV